MKRDSDSLCCPNHGWFPINHGVDALGRPYCEDLTCPDCGASPEDPLDPDVVTDDSPLLDDWIGNNAPQCQDCEESAEFVLPANRKPGEERLRWKCQAHGWVDAEGKPLDPAGEIAAQGKQVAA